MGVPVVRKIAQSVLWLSILTVAVAATAQKKNPAKPVAKPAATASKVTVLKKTLPANAMIYDLLKVSNVWTANARLAPIATELRSILQNAHRQGLSNKDYWTTSLEELYTQLNALPPAPPVATPTPAPAVDVAMTPTAPSPVVIEVPAPAPTPEQVLADKFESEAMAALIKYASDLNIGRVNPLNVGEDVRIPRKTFALESLAAVLKNVTGSLDESLSTLAPQWPAYTKLKNTLDRLLRINADLEFPAITVPAKNLKLGDQDPSVFNLKMRLQTLGYKVSAVNASYDAEAVALVKEYCVDHALGGNGELNRNSPIWSHIGVSLEARLQQIRMTMEKIRWLPTTPDDRYVHVNIAYQRLDMFERTGKAFSMKTINGREKRKTPMIKDKLTAIELNPSWTVPVRLIIEDKIPMIQRDPWFFARNNFVVYDGYGREMNPAYVDWSYMSDSEARSITLRQSPGLGNALGIMKFHLTNPYAIYLHDTNERELFAKRDRLLSSGCVRLERPVDFAAYLLSGHPKWGNIDTLRASLATTRLASRNVPRQFQIPMSQPVPVYLVYHTAEVEDGGKVKFAVDQYGQDLRLFNLLKAKK